LDLIIITNGPGELATWARSTVEYLKRKKNDARLAIFLPPCPFSSGREEIIAKNIPGVDVVINPRQFMEFLLRGNAGGFRASKKGLVVFLGGDLMHALLVSKKTGFPSIAYTVRPSFLNRYFLYCLVSDENTRTKLINSGVNKEAVKVTGNLSLAGIKINYSKKEALREWNMSEDTLTVGLMPGSREALFRPFLPYYLKVAEQIKREIDVQFLLALAPYISLETLEDSLVNIDTTGEVSRGELKEDERGYFIDTEENVRIRVIQNMQYDVINCSDLILCIPGTITAEVACLGIPMIVCYSFIRPEIIPVGGVAALIQRFPLMGSFFKRFFLKKLAGYILKSMPFLSLPNILAGEEVVPEVNISYYAEEVSRPALTLLGNQEKREEISGRLKSLYKIENAGEKVGEIILEAMEKI